MLCKGWQTCSTKRLTALAASTLACINNRLCNSDHTQDVIACSVQMTITTLYICLMKQGMKPSEELSKHAPASHSCTRMTLILGIQLGLGLSTFVPGRYCKCHIGELCERINDYAV